MSGTRRSILWIVGFVVLLGAFTEARRLIGNRTEKPQTSPRNVYLITVTGLCSSHLSSYLYQHSQTPAIDFLAYDGVRFLNAFSPAVRSLSAHLSILAGLYPFHKNFGSDCALSGPTVSTFLQNSAFSETGYRKAAFVADPELRVPVFLTGSFDDAAAGDRMLPPWKESYTNAVVCRRAKEWVLQHRGVPQFVLLNFNEPTEPFLPPAPYDKYYRAHPYDGEIAAVDEQIGLFVQSLKTSGLFQNSIVVLTSPYGACPAEDAAGSKVEEQIHVPLMIAAPGILPRHQEYEQQVSLVDIAPTILELLEMPVKPVFDGLPLFEKGSARQVEREAVFGEFSSPFWFGPPDAYYARTRGSLWLTNGGPATSLAARNLLERLKEEGIELPPGIEGAEFFRQVALPARMENFEQALVSLDSYTREREDSCFTFWQGALLQASGKSQEAPASPELLPAAAELLLQRGQYGAALQALEQYKNTTGRSWYLYDSMIGIILYHLNRSEEAFGYLERALRANPGLAVAYTYRGLILADRKQIKLAERDFRKAITLDAEDYRAMIGLARTLQSENASADARKLSERVLLYASDPDLRAQARKLISD